MRLRFRSLCIFAPLAAVPACAPNPAPDLGPEVAGGPRLIGCAAYTPPLHHWTTDSRVWVQFTVRPDGTVEPGSAQHVPSHHDRGGSSAAVRALTMAESCVFAPATREGHPVEATARMRFAFNG